jgi:type 2 lantibiotic biosynthesis protein LanM
LDLPRSHARKREFKERRLSMTLDERLLARAATVDEVLSEAFDRLPAQQADNDLAERRLAAWCRSSAGGDWALFRRRLRRDGLSIEDVRARFATVCRNPGVPAPGWVEDADWIGQALQASPGETVANTAGPCAFEDLLEPVVRGAENLLWSGVDDRVADMLGDGARACLRRSLTTLLSDLAASALYERFAKVRDDGGPGGCYNRFVETMRAAGWRQLFDDKPVLLRLMASLTRQWIEASTELIARLDADLPAIRRDLLAAGTSGPSCQVTSIDGDLSDRHHFGRTVTIIGFRDGSRVVYKPKDLRVDAAWHGLVERLNRHAPVELRAVRVLARDGYGWTEFIDHTSCVDPQGFQQYFRRAGAWLALFHCFVGVDMHQENIIACGEHPVPIDLEMILQAAEPWGDADTANDGDAFQAAMVKIMNSVVMVGVLPTYSWDSNETFSMGAVISNSAPRTTLTWNDLNSDAMRPAQVVQTDATIPNLPHIDGCHARLDGYVDDFTSGFGDYAAFLQRQHPDDLLAGFAGLPIRKVVRPTRFYGMLLQHLRDHRAMDDGVGWSAQADFAAQLADWEHDIDPAWPLLRAERATLVDLNVPHFVMASDGHGPNATTSGLDRARARVRSLDDEEIAWQTELIRQSTATLGRVGPSANRGTGPTLLVPADGLPGRDVFTAEADAVARTLSQCAVRKGSSAAWIGLDWLGGSELSQLVVLGPDLYKGACGIALFLAAHAAVSDSASSQTLARAALSRLQGFVRGPNARRVAFQIGLGGGFGLGSIVYGLAVIGALLRDDEVLADAAAAAALITADVVSADRRLDVLGGGAGAILGLLRLYRQTGSGDALERATMCGRHLLAQRGSWPPPASGGPPSGPRNGMSHGAAGCAYALASLASASGDDEFASAATEYIALEKASLDAPDRDWSDLGLAWAALTRHPVPSGGVVRTDIENAVAAAEHGWPGATDALCRGTLGSIEFLCEAAGVLGRDDLRERASRRLLSVIETARSSGDYRWTGGTTSSFNLGLFRGVAGVGYTALRRIEPSLPNVLIWE